MEWEKIFANHLPDKGLLYKIYKGSLQLNRKRPNNQIFLMGKGPKQTFLQRRHTNGQQVQENVLNITNPQGNANPNHNKTSSHTHQNVLSVSVLSCSVTSDSLQPHGLQISRLLCPQDFPGKNTTVGCHFILQ